MQTNTTPTLLQAIRQDPDTGLRWAMRDYAALVRGIARRILPGHDRDIEECTADVFVALWRNAARLEATGTPVRAWLIVTARNTAINRYRALQRHDTLPLTDELAATIADLPADPAGDAADELAVLVAALEPPDREIFLRKYYLMQSSREIAAAPKVLMAAYPVRGLDINSSYMIYNLLNEQKEKGVAVMLVGEDLDVLIELCDRILVLCGGKINGILDARTTTKEEIGLRMTKLRKEAE